MDKKDIIIGYVCGVNPFEDRYSWSGLYYKIREAIENAGFKVVWIRYSLSTPAIRFWENVRWRLYRLLGRKLILGGVHYLPVVMSYAYSVKRDENFEKCDFLFFPGGAQISLFLKCCKPIVYYTDATAHLMVDYYWRNCNPISVKMACYLEKKASQKASINIRASKWAIHSVINDCNCNAKYSKVLEFGATIDEKDIKPSVAKYDGECLNVLFSGVDWERKGGDVAVETVRLLRQMGVNAYLNIVGIDKLPDYCRKLDFIINHGFLNKNDPDSYNSYIQLYNNNHIFLLPTKAECAGIVFSEASGFGLPAYTYATGGTENYVLNGINGYALPSDAGSSEFANKIFDDITSGNYCTLRSNAVNLYKDKLSWSSWSNRFRDIMNEYMKH